MSKSSSAFNYVAAAVMYAAGVITEIPAFFQYGTALLAAGVDGDEFRRRAHARRAAASRASLGK